MVFPDNARVERTALYARWVRGEPTLVDPTGILRLKRGSQVEFCTFFNAFSHVKWRRLTAVQRLSLRVTGSGSVAIRVLAYGVTGAAVVLLDRTLELQAGTDQHVTVGELDELPGELLALELAADEADVLVASAAWVTESPPRRQVRLAAVIVTFRREAAILHAIERFSAVTIPHSPQPLHLFVIDNGRTLDMKSSATTTIIANPNLGGAGGFARGLLAAREAGTFTHVLFMDDDASCEPESVWRSMVLSAFLADERAGIAGAMLPLDRPTEQYEKGGYLDIEAARGAWHPLGGGARLAEIADVVRNDGPDRANYGAWWFFCFPLAAAIHMPFPFFVRGDDADFSVVNRLPIVTLNGIASWCEDFGRKVSARTEYLTYRSWLVLALIHGDRRSAAKNLREVSRHALTFAFRFDYACMAAIIDAVEDVGHGPGAFADAPALVTRLAVIAARERKAPLQKADLSKLTRLPRGNAGRVMLGIVSLGGHLLPRPMTSNAIPNVQVAWEAGRFRLVGFTAVAVGSGRDCVVYRRNTHLMLKELGRLIQAGWGIWRCLPELVSRYKAESPALRSEAYWRQQFEAAGDAALPDKSCSL